MRCRKGRGIEIRLLKSEPNRIPRHGAVGHLDLFGVFQISDDLLRIIKDSPTAEEDRQITRNIRGRPAKHCLLAPLAAEVLRGRIDRHEHGFSGKQELVDRILKFWRKVLRMDDSQGVEICRQFRRRSLDWHNLE